MNRVSYRVALGGIVAAFCLICMFLTGAFPLLYLVLPMLSGVLLLVVVEEVSTAWAWVTYIAVGLLSLFVTYDKEAALIFIMFFGCYPILRKYLNRIRPKLLQVGVKLLFFNVTMVAYFYLNVYLLGLQDMLEMLDEFGKYGGAGLLVLLNPFFLMYDYMLFTVRELYRLRLKPRITGKRR